MLVFDEGKKAEQLLQKGCSSLKNIGKEKAIICRYLKTLGKTDDEILAEMKKADKKLSIYKYMDEDDIERIYRNIIVKANEFPYIHNIECSIYKSEMDIIMNIKDESLRKLLFVYLVHYKWSCQIQWRTFPLYGKIWCLDDDLDLFKFAKIGTTRKDRRDKLIRKLFNSGLYESLIIKTKYRYNIPFAVNSGEEVIRIKNYEDLIGYIDYYLGEKVLCQECGKPIKRNFPNEKYCNCCAEIVKRRKATERKRKQKSRF